MYFQTLLVHIIRWHRGSDPAYCNSVVCLSVCMSVILVHPAKAVGQSEMPFGKDTLVVPSKTVLDRDPGLPTERGDLTVGLGIGTPSQKLIANCSQTVTDSRILTIDSL